MYSKSKLIICWLIIMFFSSFRLANAQVSNEQFEVLKQELLKQKQEIDNLKSQMNQETHNLRDEIESYSPLFLVLFLYGGFCALWAQHTGRIAFAWFFLGLIFSIITVIIILIINYGERRRIG